MSTDDYADRKGYDSAFLRPGKRDGRVYLPTLSAELKKSATVLTGSRTNVVLKYRCYSVVMHRVRRFAIYSAANVDFSGRSPLTRPTDVWRVDPRIAATAQVDDAYYAGNRFDRGHLTRREDLEYGVDAAAALAAAADTCHWTNCTPQHARFNESAQLWQGLERHILEQAVEKNGFRAQVITGPIFDAGDPLLDGFPDTPYPLRYWKVVAAIDAAGDLFATAYVLDQKDVIAQYGLREAPAVPFTPFKTYQTTIAEIERLTALAFTGSRGAKRTPLSAFDPLARQAAVARDAMAGPYIALDSLDRIVLPASARQHDEALSAAWPPAAFRGEPRVPATSRRSSP